MSQNPQERSKDSKKVAEDNIEEQQMDIEDPTESVEVTGDVEGKATGVTGSSSSGL